jgi:hypothetical protein
MAALVVQRMMARSAHSVCPYLLPQNSRQAIGNV